MPHICGAEITALIAALPIIGYCLRCIRAKFTQTKKEAS